MRKRTGFGLVPCLLLAVLTPQLAAQPLAVANGSREIQVPAAPKLLLIMDIHADPFGFGGQPGAIFVANPRTGKVMPVASDPNWECPIWVEPRDKVWLVVDLCKPAVLRAPRLSGDQPGLVNSTVLFSTGLVNPVRWFELPNGDRLIADRGADPLGLGTRTGAVFRTRGSPPGPLEVFIAGPEIVVPASFTTDDRGNNYLLDADARPIPHPNGGEGTIYRFDDLGNLTLAAAPVDTYSPLQLFFVPDDGTDSAGKVIVIDTNAGLLTTPFPTGKIFRIDLGLPWPVTANEIVTADPLLADPTGGLYERPDTILVADMNADPLGLGFDGVGLGYSTFGRGAIYRVDLRTGALTVAVASPLFRNPTQMVWADETQARRLGLATH